jgi:DNA-binding transcriptional MerR regulator/uncharacterized protein (DUF433 family)
LGSVSRLDLGAYEASRAAALSGVPERTVYHWARTGLVVPSVSADRDKLWSYGDLLTLRLVRWLRTDKHDVARTKMQEVRTLLDEVGDALWSADDGDREVPSIRVTRAGEIILIDAPARTVYGQQVLSTDMLDLLAPFEDGVDLRRPRPHLRIVPGKVSGEIHLHGSRLTSRAVAGLARQGLTVETIAELYPDESHEGLREAIEVEDALAA